MFSPQDALPLPPRPSIEQYKKRAKDLVKAANSQDSSALRSWAKSWIESLVTLSDLKITPQLPVSIDRWIDQLTQFVRGQTSARFSLTKAQFLLARAHGFESWPKLAKHIAAVARKKSPTSAFEQAADGVITGDLATLALLLSKNPDLPRARSTRQHQATLLHYIAANGVEGYRQKTPANAVQVAQLLLDSGAAVNATAQVYGGHATTLALVATSLHPEQAGLQESLLQLLLDHGAPLDANIIPACLANGRLRAAEFLAHRGAKLDLESAAGIGRLDVVKTFFNEEGNLKNATTLQMHRGFLWAAEYGRNAVVEFLLDRGVPVDTQATTGQTALHWAVIGAHVSTVKLLLSHGASLEAKNTYGGTALGQACWSAAHGDKGIDYAPVIETLIQADAKKE